MKADVNEPLSNLPPTVLAAVAPSRRCHGAVVEVREAELGGEDDGVVGAEREARLEDGALEIIWIVGC